MLKINKVRDCLNKSMKAGKAIPATKEARETILAAINIANQVITVRSNIRLRPGILNARPSNTPSVVAIPLPPLKLRKIVQLWPQIQLKPKIIRTASSESKVILGPRRFPRKNTTRKPFNISRNRTAMPGALPRTRRALVAPTLPEPDLRISIPLSNRPKI